ncbi:CbiX/SirB N-terminal domain-containing protein [Natrialbaceae archaeon AArc-T1-2]|uniref:CbiX/SirB N-terminal domain-containing protein n=1 Tax=Natrialbaceae archaeon AArc-T1-2 TaxID=3053904 RepID=UPI00255AB278|nr:CbiX/SirB N-terminal domain-containing protein [Natrialbaceae archaeon AArc-T1-2]WIV66470.1 CbiX/SirB N-terminal domain-containing protein [Natrialbaceae archaeon AArc-T1-2]
MSVDGPELADDVLADDAVLVVGHGSRREKSNEQVRKLAAMLEERVGVPADVAYLELAEPAIPEAIEELAPTCEHLSVVPLSLFGASHVKNDVPLAVQTARAQYDDLSLHCGSHLGVHPALVELLDERARAVEDELGVDREDDDVAVVVCARGSSDPDANADAHKLSRLLYEGRAFTRVETAFIGVTEPRLEDALHTVAKGRPDAVVVLPYMLGDGVLTGRIRDRTDEFDAEYPYVAAGAGEPLGTDERIVKVLADRFREARTGGVEMSCDTCKYKVELDGYEDDQGGARAMLRSLVHQAEHADREDVGDDPHVHDAPENHVAVCTNQTCAGSGATTVLERLRQEARDAEACDVHITRSSCLGQCGEGPMVAVYPDGIWYGGVTPEDTERIVSSHFERDRIVSDLVQQTL